MLFEILSLITGISLGVITGLIPGLHINLIVLLLPLTLLSPSNLIILIVAMAITHSFLDFIPSIFLGAPDEDTGLSVLPGHSLLNKGLGYLAIIHTLYGSCLGILIIIISTPLFIFLLPKILPYLKNRIFLILISTSFYLIIKEKNSKLIAVIVFLISGFLGISTLNLNLNNSLLPLLTGLFGSSSLITSIIKNKNLPKQKIGKVKIKFKSLIKSSLSSFLSAPLCTFLPSLGASQAAVIGSDIIEEKNHKNFLILLGSINTIVLGLSFITIYSINETRTGTSVAISKITNLNFNHLILILITILISGILSFFITIKISKIVAKNITKLPYKLLSLITLLLLTLLVTTFSGLPGLLIFITSTFTGLTAILTGIRRTHLMGSLMLPSILLYLPINL
jgi:putative membrane protein